MMNIKELMKKLRGKVVDPCRNKLSKVYYNVLINMKIRNKLLISFFLLVALPITTSIVINIAVVNPMMIKNTVELEQNIISQYCRDVEYKVELYNTMAQMISSDKELNDCLRKDYSDDVEVVHAYYKYFNHMTGAYSRYDSDINKVMVYLDNDSMMYDNFYLKPQDEEFCASSAWNALFGRQQSSYFAIEEGYIRIYNKMNYYRYNGNYPVTMFEISASGFTSSVDKASTTGDMFILDMHGEYLRLCGSSGRFPIIEEHLDEMTGQRGTIGGSTFSDRVIIYETTNFGWMVVKIVDPGVFFGEAIYVRNVVSVSLVVCALILLLLILLISRWLTVRIKSLVDKIGDIRSGHYDSPMLLGGRDEIGEASLALDELSSELKYLIDTVYKSKLENQKLELDVMQAKINPHFLYNTLSAMDWFMQKNDVNTSRALLNSMVLFYRGSLGSGSDVVMITDEITHLRMYLNIEERLLDNISAQIDIPDDMYNVRMVRMTLQPIVENAIKHAMRDSEEMLHIYVRGYLEDGRAVVTVEDDGVGFSREQLEEFEESRTLAVGEFGSGMGISNVDRRIRLRFGEGCGVKISNSATGGAVIKITVPYSGGAFDRTAPGMV